MSNVLTGASPALAAAAEAGTALLAGALHDAVAKMLGLAASVRAVWLHASVVDHIYAQRGADRDDAEFVLAHLPAAISRPHYCGPDPRDRVRFDLVHLPDGAERAIFVALKLVAAAKSASGADELWVSTAHPLPADFLRRKRYRESLRAVSWLDLEGGDP